MTRRNHMVSLRHMLDYSREARSLSEGRSREDLQSDRLFALAMTRLVEIIGEAGNRVPSEKRLEYPKIPWSQTIGMRNRVIHGYDVLDFDVLWLTVTERNPPLVEALESILDSGK